MDIYEEFKKILLAEGTSDDVLRKEIIREVIYKEASLLSVGEKVVPVRNFNDLDIKFHYPSEFSAIYPVPEGGMSEYAAPLTWTTFNMTLEKAEVRWMLTDEAVLRQLGQYQMDFSRRRAAEALAKAKDDEILSTLYAGATNSISAVATWNSDTAKPEDDLVKAIGKILETSNISETEIMGMHAIIPVDVWAYPMRLQSIRNIVQSVADFMKGAYKLEFHPTRYVTNDALVLVKSEMTAIHGVLQTNKIPLVEENRIKGRGTEYMVRQFFKTVVIPDSATVSTSSRICKITGVSP